MKKLTITLFLVLVFVLSSVGVASAVTNGHLDGNGHPYVGLMVAKDASGNPLWRCSGTLIAPKLFLTAGHCTEAPAATAEIWFDADVQTNAAALGYPNHGEASGKVYVHPDFVSAQFYLHDVGMVVLDKEIKSITQFGALPKLNQLDTLVKQRGQQNITFTAVGYGMQASFPDAASWKDQSYKIRMAANPQLIQINTGFTGPQSLLLSNNAATGGTCFGDSGGPNFIGNTNVIGGVTSFGMNGTCAGTGGVYRMDRSDPLNWIYSKFGKYLN